MKVVIDIEANALTNPTKVWVVVCKCLASGQLSIFRNITENENERIRFIDYAKSVNLWIGHNILEYDFPVLYNLVPGWNILQLEELCEKVNDTLLISRLVDYSRPNGHSIEAYGKELGLEKIKFNDFSKYSKEMEDYCVQDVEICHKIFDLYHNVLNNQRWRSSILLEHRFQCIVNDLHRNGFGFDTRRADGLLDKIKKELQELDKDILTAFPPRTKLIREVHPRRTQYGSLNRKDFRFCKDGDLSSYTGDPFSRFEYVPFNPASHKQLVDVLNLAGWSPVDKTETHKDIEREFRKKDVDKDLLLKYTSKLEHLRVYGWKINEENLATLPPRAPTSARLLAKRILLESRRRTLVEWLGLVQEDRIHGQFLGIGSWTGRMAHRNPNTANIPNEKDIQGKAQLYGKEFRSLWIAPKNRLLVGVDAEGIQLRIFAHYINDLEFTDALINGKKVSKTDPHSLNQRIIGRVCKHRQAAKRFIYALLLGAGLSKLSEVLECTDEQAKEALTSILRRYSGFAELKNTIIPNDARRGYFIGLDGRKVIIPSETLGGRRHLAMSGYLQLGEVTVMKLATLKWQKRLKEKGITDWLLVNLVHDEWQTETKNNMKEAIEIARLQADSLREVGEDLNLKCPLSGSYFDEDRKDYTIGVNWKLTH